jgi:parvulin-like peptidyl-prolyl isomerase
MNIIMTKAAILAELNAQLDKAKKYDAIQLVKYEKTIASELVAFRKRLREAMTWKPTEKSIYQNVSYDRNSKPHAIAPQYTHWINQIKRDSRDKIVFGHASPLQNALDWNPKDEE